MAVVVRRFKHWLTEAANCPSMLRPAPGKHVQDHWTTEWICRALPRGKAALHIFAVRKVRTYILTLVILVKPEVLVITKAYMPCYRII